MNHWFRLSLYLRNRLNFMKIWIDHFGNQWFICKLCNKEFDIFQEWSGHVCEVAK